MSDKEIHLRDYIRIKVDAIKLDDAQEVSFRDSFNGPRKKGLLVTFDLSHSGKKINNRIYPAWAHRDGASTWTDPFPRPIILNHDNRAENTIGRFVSVVWESLETEAIDHLGSLSNYLEVKRALDSNSPKAIYKIYNKYGLFQDKNWPGVGKLVAKALITDQDSVEKFLDGRYLTFSAGQKTNALTCMVCDSGWHTGDICDHRPGMEDEDGNVAYFMTGLLSGDEGSVVNGPADTQSQVRNLELQDFKSEVIMTDDAWSFIGTDENTFVFTDSVMEAVPMKKIGLEDLTDLEPKTIANKLIDGSLEIDLTDLKGETQLEIKWLMQIHDSLHYRYDSAVAGEYGEKIENIATDAFKLHGMIHEVAQDKGFRDSLINGELDGFDMKGGASELYRSKRVAQDTDTASDLTKLKDEIMDVVKEALKESTASKDVAEVKDEANTDAAAVTDVAKTEDSAANVPSTQEEKEEEAKEVAPTSLEDQIKSLLAGEDDVQVVVAKLKDLMNKEVPDLVDDESIDWFLLDAGLNAIVGEAKLTDESRKSLADIAFCGPNRSFPIADTAHVIAARTLIEGAKLTDSQSKALLACVDKKAQAVADNECPCGACTCGKITDSVKTDYVEALRTIDSLKNRLTAVLEKHAVALEAKVSDAESGVRLDSLQVWFDTIEPVENKTEDSKNPIEHIKEVENPSGATSQDSQSVKKLGTFEQDIVNEYKSIRDKDGQEQADRWLYFKRKYLPASLDITKYLTN